jgi:hypothetical protein
MKKKIAVICAYNPRNCGMYSVDLAAKYFLDQLGADFTLFVTQQKNIDTPSVKIGKLRYESLRSLEQLEDYSTIIYWGDFLNNPTYGLEDFAEREVYLGYTKSKSTGYKNWLKLCMLDNYNSEKTVLSVSNNFQTISSFIFPENQQNIEKISSIYENRFDFISPRDSYSMKLLKSHFPNAAIKKTYEGIDASFLLNQTAIYPELKTISKNKTFAFYFKRSKIKGLYPLLFKIWLKTGYRPVPICSWLRMSRSNPDYTYVKALKKMKAAEFVLSDTYHCLVNSINLETKTIGIGLKAESQGNTCGDFKKKILFSDINLLENYIEFEKKVCRESEDELFSRLEQILLATNLDKMYNLLDTKRQAYSKKLENLLS